MSGVKYTFGSEVVTPMRGRLKAPRHANLPQGRKMKKIALALALVGFAVGAWADNPKNSNSSASCDYNKMDAQGIKHLSWGDAEMVCRTMAASLGRQPTIALLDTMSKLLFVLRVAGLKDEYKDVAYQVMNIVEARNQVNDNGAIDNTMNVIVKIFNGSQGHVTPKDMNIAIRHFGKKAEKFTDERMYFIAAVIQEAKKSRGE